MRFLKHRRALGLFLFLLFLEALYFLNRDYLRPTFRSNYYVVLLLGSLPNFLASLGAGLFFNFPILLDISALKQRWFVYVITIITLFLLILEELTPCMFGSRVGDINDMIASVIGSIISLLYFEKLKSGSELDR